MTFSWLINGSNPQPLTSTGMILQVPSWERSHIPVEVDDFIPTSQGGICDDFSLKDYQ